MYTQLSFGVVSCTYSKLCNMNRSDWDKFDNKKRIKMEYLKSKMAVFIQICVVTGDDKSTFPVQIDDQPLILEIIK